MTTSTDMPVAEVVRQSVAENAVTPDRCSGSVCIVGCCRSGTTLRSISMIGHSRLHILPESHFVGGLIKDVPLRKPLSRTPLADVVERSETHPRWRVIGITIEEFGPGRSRWPGAGCAAAA